MSEPLTISIITAVHNRAATVADCLQSVASQSHPAIEHIVVDALSSDGTSEIVSTFSKSVARHIREADNGIYDALNKGIQAATGEVVGFLHADDVLADPEGIAKVAAAHADPDVLATYADLRYVSADRARVVRRWSAGPYRRSRFWWGWMPPHPTVYMKRSVFDRFGYYDCSVGTAADYEFLVRTMVRNSIRTEYIPTTLVEMRVGGMSNVSLANRLAANSADRRAWIRNGMRPPFALRVTKPGRKLAQFLP